MMVTTSFSNLPAWMQEKLKLLYTEYFYIRQDHKWRHTALERLPNLLKASRTCYFFHALNLAGMLICGEDLGMIPACVPDVMQDLSIMCLRIQRFYLVFLFV